MAVLAAVPAVGEGGLSMDVTVGLGGAARYGRYTPVIVSLENRGARIEGTLRVESSHIVGFHSQIGSEVHEKRVVLPTRARMRAGFAIPLSTGARPLVVRMMAGGRELIRKEIDLRSILASDRIVAVMSGGASLDFLYGLENRGSPLRLVYPHVESLPESWIGYDGVDLIVLHDIPAGKLSAPQAEAIRRWVTGGGILVVSGGLPALGHAAAGLDALLPSGITGVRMARFLGGVRGIAETRSASWKPLLEEGNLVLASGKDLGAGRIVFAAFDVAASDLADRSEPAGFWQSLLERPRSPVLNPDRSLPADEPDLKAVLASSALEFPSTGAVAVFLAVYGACVAALAWPRTLSGLKPGARCAAFASVSLAAAVAGCLLFGRVLYADAAGLVDVSVVQADPGGLARVRQDTLLAAAAPGTYEVRIASSDVAVEDGGSLSRDPSAELALEVSRGVVVRGIVLPRYGSRVLRLHAVLEFPLEASWKGGGLLLSNRTGAPLRECLVVRGGTAYSIGDAGPGQRTIGAARLETPAARTAADSLRRQLADQTIAGLDKGATWVLGWRTEPLLRVEVPASFARSVRECLVIIEVSPAPLREGSAP